MCQCYMVREIMRRSGVKLTIAIVMRRNAMQLDKRSSEVITVIVMRSRDVITVYSITVYMRTGRSS